MVPGVFYQGSFVFSFLGLVFRMYVIDGFITRLAGHFHGWQEAQILTRWWRAPRASGGVNCKQETTQHNTWIRGSLLSMLWDRFGSINDMNFDESSVCCAIVTMNMGAGALRAPSLFWSRSMEWSLLLISRKIFQLLHQFIIRVHSAGIRYVEVLPVT